MLDYIQAARTSPDVLNLRYRLACELTYTERLVEEWASDSDGTQQVGGTQRLAARKAAVRDRLITAFTHRVLAGRRGPRRDAS